MVTALPSRLPPLFACYAPFQLGLEAAEFSKNAWRPLEMFLCLQYSIKYVACGGQLILWNSFQSRLSCLVCRWVAADEGLAVREGCIVDDALPRSRKKHRSATVFNESLSCRGREFMKYYFLETRRYYTCYIVLYNCLGRRSISYPLAYTAWLR